MAAAAATSTGPVIQPVRAVPNAAVAAASAAAAQTASTADPPAALTIMAATAIAAAWGSAVIGITACVAALAVAEDCVMGRREWQPSAQESVNAAATTAAAGLLDATAYAKT